MLPIASSLPSRLGASEDVDRHPPQIEVSGTDVTEVESVALAEGVLSKLGPGDKIYLKSDFTGAYRRIARVEPIGGGGVLIWLDSGYVLHRKPLQSLY